MSALSVSFIRRERAANRRAGRKLDVADQRIVDIARRLTRLEAEFELIERRKGQSPE